MAAVLPPRAFPPNRLLFLVRTTRLISRSLTLLSMLTAPRGSGESAAYDGARRRKGSKVHIAPDTLGHLLALNATAASAGDREQMAALAAAVQEVTGSTVELAYVDQGYAGSNAAEVSQQHGIRLEAVKHPLAKRCFVLLPRRWVVGRGFAWAPRFRRLARDYERLDTTLKGFHFIAFAVLRTARLVRTAMQSA